MNFGSCYYYLIRPHTHTHRHNDDEKWLTIQDGLKEKKKSFLLMNVSDLSSSIPTQYTGTPCGNACFFFPSSETQIISGLRLLFLYYLFQTMSIFFSFFFPRPPPPCPTIIFKPLLSRVVELVKRTFLFLSRKRQKKHTVKDAGA